MTLLTLSIGDQWGFSLHLMTIDPDYVGHTFFRMDNI